MNHALVHANYAEESSLFYCCPMNEIFYETTIQRAHYILVKSNNDATVAERHCLRGRLGRAITCHASSREADHI